MRKQPKSFHALRERRRMLTVQEAGNLYRIRHGEERSTPLLTLKGQWMALAGIAAGDRVVVEVEADRLIIRRPRS